MHHTRIVTSGSRGSWETPRVSRLELGTGQIGPRENEAAKSANCTTPICSDHRQGESALDKQNLSWVDNFRPVSLHCRMILEPLKEKSTATLRQLQDRKKNSSMGGVAGRKPWKTNLTRPLRGKNKPKISDSFCLLKKKISRVDASRVWANGLQMRDWGKAKITSLSLGSQVAVCKWVAYKPHRCFEMRARSGVDRRKVCGVLGWELPAHHHIKNEGKITEEKHQMLSGNSTISGRLGISSCGGFPTPEEWKSCH